MWISPEIVFSMPVPEEMKLMRPGSGQKKCPRTYLVAPIHILKQTYLGIGQKRDRDFLVYIYYYYNNYRLALMY
jgi:hypothetical protein